MQTQTMNRYEREELKNSQLIEELREVNNFIDYMPARKFNVLFDKAASMKNNRYKPEAVNPVTLMFYLMDELSLNNLYCVSEPDGLYPELEFEYRYKKEGSTIFSLTLLEDGVKYQAAYAAQVDGRGLDPAMFVDNVLILKRYQLYGVFDEGTVGVILIFLNGNDLVDIVYYEIDVAASTFSEEPRHVDEEDLRELSNGFEQI